jgi:hypothetical protein
VVIVLNFKLWIKNRTFQALLATNLVVIILTIFFSLFTPFSIINFEIHASGWTSIAALVLGDYLGVKAIQAEQQIATVFGNTDIQGAILHMDGWIKSMDRFAETPEGQEFLKKLILLMDTIQKLSGVE